MPVWAKALIAILILGVLVVLATIGAGVYWFSRNKDQLLAKGKAQYEEGVAAGRATDNQGCVDRGIERYKADPGIASGIASGIFMQSCLEVSSPTEGFCDDIPKESEFIKSGQWRLEQCQRVDLASDNYCQQLFAPVQRFCDKQGTVRKSAEP